MSLRRFTSPRRPLARGRPTVALLAALLGLAGCASTLDVRPLATERADLSAYELSGSDLAALHREAGQLCPQGGEILRQSARDQRLEAVDSRMERWVHFSSTWITPIERSAQLVVLCHVVPGRQLLAAAGAAAAVSAVAPASASTPVATAPLQQASTRPASAPILPIGPVTVEW